MVDWSTSFRRRWPTIRITSYSNNEYGVKFRANCDTLECPSAGFQTEFFRIILDLMGLQYQLILDDNVTSYDDMYRFIGDNRADIALIPSIVDRKRLGEFKYSNAFSISNYGYAGLLLEKAITNLDYIREPLTWPVVATFVCLIVALSFTFLLSDIVSRRRERKPDWTLYEKLCVFGGYCWCLPFIVIRQTIRDIRGTWSKNIAISTYACGAFLIAFAYESVVHLIFIVVINIGLPFLDMEQLVSLMEAQGWKIAMYADGYRPVDICALWRDNNETCDRFLHLNESVLIRPSFAAVLQEIQSPKTITILTQDSYTVQSQFSYMLPREGILFLRDQTLPPAVLSFFMTRNIPGFTEYFNRALSILGEQAYLNVKNRQRNRRPFVEFVRKSELSELDPVPLSTVTILLYYVLAFYGVAFLVFVVERVVDMWKKKRSAKSVNQPFPRIEVSEV